jgi:UDP-N-acetylmuramyl pentapeptide phosphotransferase/UDP-N-acetylglucosamine-1-phosphate transferase
MQFFILSFLTSCIVSLLVVRSANAHARISADRNLTGPQKFHARPVPRVGGVGIFMGLLIGIVWADAFKMPMTPTLWLLLLTAMPAFLSGLAEDLARNVAPRWRLWFIAGSSGLGIWLLDAVIIRTDIPGLDTLIQWYPVAVGFTVLAVTGLSNAINIIDGFNGLASMCALFMLLAVAYVSYQVGDVAMFSAAVIVAGAALGFFVWNFPAGLIFLGDGGAYLLGFLLGELCIMIVHRNERVSPMFPLLLCAYPVFETVFTMYRRKFVRGVATGAPDGIHLHTLIHRRLIRWTLQDSPKRRRLTRRNSMTSPYLWVLCLMTIIPSLLWWDSTPALLSFMLVFILLYVWLYSRIVRFKTPRWMVFRRTR